MLHKLLFDQSPDIMLVFRGSDGRITDANTAAVTAYGCSREELLRKNFYSLHFSEDMHPIVSEMNEAAPARIIDARHRYSGTSEIPVIVSLRCGTVDGEKIICCTLIDLMVHKRIEGQIKKDREEFEKTVEERTARLRLNNIQLQLEINERKLVEEMLWRSESRLCQITDNMLDMICQTDKEGNYLYASPSHKNVLGYEISFLLGKPTYAFIHPDDLETVLNNFKKGIEEKIPGRMEYRYRHAEGHYIWLETIGNVLFDDKGEITGTILGTRDITLRKMAEEALLSEKRRFENLLEKSPFGMFMFDNKFMLKYINPKFKELFGYDLDEITNGRKWLVKAYPEPSYRHKVLSEWFNDIKAAESGAKQQRVYTVTCKDRTKKIVSFITVQIENGAHLVTCEDITQRRRVEIELQEKSLFLQRLIDNIPNPIFYKDVYGIYKGCNKAFEAFLGRIKNDIVGKSVYDLSPPDLADEYHKMDEALFRAPGIQIYDSSVTYADGTRHSVIFNKAAYFNTDGTLAGLVGVISDIEERKKAEEELKQSEALLRSIIESPQNIITFSLDNNYRYLSFNRAHHATMKKIWGADIEKGRSMLEYITYQEDSQKAAANFDRALSGEHFSVIEEYGDEKLSRVFWEDIYSPIIIDTGEIIGVTVFCTDISERMLAEEKLHAANQRLLDTIDFLPDATFVIDLSGRVIAWNRAIEEMTGVGKDDILGQGGYQYAVPFYGNPRPILIDLIFSGNSDIEAGYAYTEKKEKTIYAEGFTPCINNGKGAYMWGKASPLFDNEGKIIGAIESIRDITGRKLAEDKLQASNQQLLDIIDFLPDATFVIDQEGRVIAWNHVIEQLTGVKKEDILGKGNYSYAIPFHGEPRPIFIDLIFADESIVKQQYDYIRKEGNTFYGETFAQAAYKGKGAYLWVKASPLIDKDGNVVGAIQSIRDITGLKHLEERFRLTGKELQQALEKLDERELIDRIIETSPAGILVVNNEMKFTFANARAEQLLGLQFKDKNSRVYKMPKWFYTDYEGHPIPREELVHHQVIATGRQVVDAALAIQWPDGTRTLLSINGAPLYDRAGAIEGAVLSIEDVTLRREAEERINSYQKQLRSLAAKLALVEESERRRIAENIHDHIGQSLAVARLKIGALKRTVMIDENLKNLDEINILIEEAIKNTRSLTFELSPPILYDLGFGAAVEWLGEHLLEKNGVGFNLVNKLQPKTLDEELRVILFTAVRELFFNIIKHAQAKMVFISVRKTGDKIMLEVRDDGTGFIADLNSTGYRKAGSFGLFSINERLEHFGGRLEIVSQPGQGTRIAIEAPLASRN
jgi:PAS domain S-box-containing protein